VSPVQGPFSPPSCPSRRRAPVSFPDVIETTDLTNSNVTRVINITEQVHRPPVSSHNEVMPRTVVASFRRKELVILAARPMQQTWSRSQENESGDHKLEARR
jgi:hypothetical protein